MIETLLTKALTDGGYNVFPVTAPFDTPLPYVTYQAFGGIPVVFMDNQLADKSPHVVQINVFSSRIMEASTIAKDIQRLLLASNTFQATSDSEPSDIADDDPNSTIYGKSLDFTIWSPNQ